MKTFDAKPQKTLKVAKNQILVVATFFLNKMPLFRESSVFLELSWNFVLYTIALLYKFWYNELRLAHSGIYAEILCLRIRFFVVFNRDGADHFRYGDVLRGERRRENNLYFHPSSLLVHHSHYDHSRVRTPQIMHWKFYSERMKNILI